MSGHEAVDGAGNTSDEAADGPHAGAPSDTGATVEQLHLGQPVQAQAHGVVHWTGTVETIAVPLQVVWIREDGLGERKLLDLREYQVSPQDAAGG